MKFMDKLKELAKITDETYPGEFDDAPVDDYDNGDNGYGAYESEYEKEDDNVIYSDSSAYRSRHGAYSHTPSEQQSVGNVVDISSSARPQIVFERVDAFEDVGTVANELKEQRIVILNIETCPMDVSRRVLDFLYGVAYANGGEINRIAGRCYVISPRNVPVTGELLDEIENGSFGEV